MTTYTLSYIPEGVEGVRQTLKTMSRIVNQFKTDRQVRETALSIVRDLPEKKWLTEVSKILLWVQTQIRYVKDVNGVETLHTPPEIFRLRQGDCDDKSILLASMLESIGHPTRFIAVGFEPKKFSHVLVETRIGGKWIKLDPITKWPVGQGPQGVKSIMIQHNKGLR